MIRSVVAFALVAACTVSALAQQPRAQTPAAQAPAAPPPAAPPAAAPPSSAAPQRTTASYEDWTVRCETRGTPAVKVCEMVQAVTAPGQASPVTQVGVGRAGPKEPVKAVFQLPVNVWIPAGVRFVYDAKAAPLAAGFKWCARQPAASPISISTTT